MFSRNIDVIFIITKSETYKISYLLFTFFFRGFSTNIFYAVSRVIDFKSTAIFLMTYNLRKHETQQQQYIHRYPLVGFIELWVFT